jgi:BirA family biotin operon repressor/biotin-[acetyl-CoA-carboxylase] ligase
VATDVLTPEVVESAASGRLGRPCRVFASVGSTQDEALAWARAGAPEGALVVADEQTAGRGRRGRLWLSPRRRSLYLSVVLRPRPAPALAGALSTALGLSVAEAVEFVHALPAKLKWPNDVVVEGRKLAGILVESSAGERGIEAVARHRGRSRHRGERVLVLRRAARSDRAASVQHRLRARATRTRPTRL